MALVPLDRHPGPRVLATFALSLLATGGLLAGAALLWAERPGPGLVSGALLALGGLLAGLGPRSLRRPIYLAVALPAWLLGNLVTRVLVTALFYLLLSPLAALARALGHDPLARRPAKGPGWSPLEPGPSRPEDYERPF